MTKRILAFGLVASLLGATVACTNQEGESESPAMLTVDLEDQAGLTDVDPPGIVVIPTIILQSRLKNPTQGNPQGFADVQVDQYRVSYVRADGGTRVPPAQDFAAGVIVPTPGTATLSDYPVLSETDLRRSPFDQLLPLNGGFDRETGSPEIRIFYDVTFFGRTLAGQRVQSNTARGVRIFRNL